MILNSFSTFGLDALPHAAIALGLRVLTIKKAMTILNQDNKKINEFLSIIEASLIQVSKAIKQSRDRAQAVRLDGIRVRLEDSLSRIRERAGTSRKTRYCCNPTM